MNTTTTTITVYGNLTAGISGGTSPICYNTSPGTLTATGGGGTGTYSYQWYTTSGTISGATEPTYAPGNITSTTGYYCAITSGSCGTVNTNTTTITVYDNFSVGAIATDGETICYMFDPGLISNMADAGGGDQTISYRWQSSTDDGFTSPVTIAGSNSATYDPPAGLTFTTWYRRQANDATCNTGWNTSAGTWKVTVNAIESIVYVDQSYNASTSGWQCNRFSTIQSGINRLALGTGGTVNVAAGTYSEHVTVNIPVVLHGADKATTIIDGSGTGMVVTISASNVTFRGYTVRNSGTDPAANCGIGLIGVTGCTLQDNIVSGNASGLFFDQSNTNAVTGNTISGNSGYGVYLHEGSHGNTFTQNAVTGNLLDGFFMHAGLSGATNPNTLTNNKISDNTGHGVDAQWTNHALYNYWGGCPSATGPVTYYPYYTSCTGTPGSFEFGGIRNNIVASATIGTICAGSSTIIYATGGSEYVWGALGLGSSKVVAPSIATTYTVTAKDAFGCTGASASVSVAVNPLPVVEINDFTNDTSTIVLGEGKLLTASTGLNSYLWSTGATDDHMTVYPSASTTYTVSASNGLCSASATHTVNVGSVSAGPNQYICQGGSAKLKATVTGITATMYTWLSDPSGFTSSEQSPTFSNITSTTIFTVTINNTPALHSHVTVFVRAKPNANAGPDITIAGGSSGIPGILTGSATLGTSPYSWSWSGPGIIGSSTTQNVSVNAAGTYTLIVTDVYGCSSNADQVEVTIPSGGNVVSGNVSYYGAINPQMHNVLVTLTGPNGTFSGITPASGLGNYQIPGVPNGTYTVSFSLSTLWGGVTTADIILIQKHYTPPTVPLIGLKRLAADVYANSASASITVDDRNLLNNKRLNPNGVSFETGNWVFTRTEDVLANSSFMYANSAGTTNITIEVPGTTLINNFKSLCYGDVDGSYSGYKMLDPDDKVVDVTQVNGMMMICYPNPFTDRTTLEYYLPVNGDVNIAVYNMLGTKVATIDRPQQTEGTYEFKWEPVGMPTGMYVGVVTLRTSDDVIRQQVKMLLTK